MRLPKFVTHFCSICFSLVLFPAIQARGALVDAFWDGGTNNWSVGTAWTPDLVPNNGTGGNTYHVRIDNGLAGNSIVNMNISPTIDMLTISIGDTLSFNNVQDLRIEIGPIVNDGLISLNGLNSPTVLQLASSMSLMGAGVIEGNNDPDVLNYITGLSAATPFLLVNTATHSIRGGVRIGENTLNLTNEGLIEASQPAAPLFIDLADGSNVNTGTIQSIGTSTLNINNTVLDNTAGFIKALGTSHTRFSASTVNGGQLQADAGATFSGAGAFFKDITLTGLFQVFNVDDIHCEGTITNNGVFRLLGANSPTEFRVLDNGVTLAGTGVLEGNNDSDVPNYINDNGAVTPPLLINTATHTIRGGIRVGNNRVLLTNDGLIDASITGAPMTIDLAAGANVNTGTIQASGSSLLNITGTVLDNTTGFIKSLGTSAFGIVDGSEIHGGQLQADPGAYFAGRSSLLKNITLTGLLRQFNVDDVTYEGTITNNGTIRLEGVNSPTVFQVHDNGVTLAGTGVLEGTNDPDVPNYISGAVTPPLLVNTATHTIRGGIRVGNNGIILANAGLIDASVTGAPMTIDLADGANVNTGTIQASGSSTLNITGTVLDNTAGFIKALGTSAIGIIDGTEIHGGQLQADTGAYFAGRSSLLKNVTLTGLLRQFNIDDVTYEGTITNNGTIELLGLNSPTEIIVPPSGVTFAGSGEIVFGNDPDNPNLIDDSETGPTPTFVNGATHTIRGSGNLGANGVHITNQGNIIANQTTPMVFDAPDSGQGFLNNGSILVQSVLNIVAGVFTNAGTVEIEATRTLNRTGPYTQTAGETNVNGTLNASGGVQIQGGVLSGTGAVSGAGSLVTNSGIIAPGNSAGQLNLNNGLFQTPSGEIAIEIGGLTPVTQHDVLNLLGTIHFDGTLSVSFVNGFDPQVGDSFTVITYPNQGITNIGFFRTIEAPCNLPGRAIQVDVHVSFVRVRVVAAANSLYDVNCDCVFSYASDTSAFINALLFPGTFATDFPGCDILNADFNNDNLVDGQDVQGFVDALVN